MRIQDSSLFLSFQDIWAGSCQTVPLKKCGSSMRVRSAIGRGTVFELSLNGGEERVSDR
jgi:hypothetical protein